MMNKVAKFLVFVVTCIILTGMLYRLTVTTVVPEIKYSNKINLNLAYLNYDDLLVIAFKQIGDQDNELNKFNIPKTNYLQPISLELPYTYAPSLYFLFGESYPVSVAINGFYINGKPVSTDKLVKEFQKIGYTTFEQDSVLYASPTENVKIGALDLYSLSEDFVNLSESQIYEYTKEEQYIKCIYFMILFTVIIFGMHLLKKFLNIRKKHISDGFVLAFGWLLYSVLFWLAIFSLNINQNINVENSVILVKNYMMIWLVPLFVYCLTTSFNPRNYIVILASLLCFAFMFIVGIDIFVQQVFGTRFLFNYVGKFAGNVGGGFPFFVDFVSSQSGFSYVLAIITMLGAFALKNEKKQSFTSLIFVTICSFLSASALFVGNSLDYRHYFNLFQVNTNGLFTDGDYDRPYNEYKPYTAEMLNYETKQGLGAKQNVIIILVESLGCNVTKLCGDYYDYSPYMKELAKQNVWFPNYYSNAYHTNGAIFAVTTGFPYVGGPNADKTPFNQNLYLYDLVSAFKNNGYKTAYFSPAPQIMGKDLQLKMSKYDYISFSSDPYYDKSSKQGVFFSATDEELFGKMLQDLEKSDQPIFFMTTTISTHTPYMVPWGTHDIAKAYAYSDYAIRNFIEKLKSINYFDNGIVVVTGDHIGWGITKDISIDPMELNKVPMILINGKDHGIVDDVSFSHTSLSVMLEYMMLPEYKQSQYQINPLTDRNSHEYILHYDTDDINNVYIKHGDKKDKILLDGDHTRFTEKSFSKEEQDMILGYLSWIRQ